MQNTIQNFDEKKFALDIYLNHVWQRKNEYSTTEDAQNAARSLRVPWRIVMVIRTITEYQIYSSEDTNRVVSIR